MEIAIINEELFKENGPIKEDTIISKFVPYIIIAQKMYLRPILGRALLDEIQDEIKDASETPPPDPNPISPDNQALILEVAPVLSLYAVYQGLPFHWAEIVNKGITIRASENSNPVAISDIAQMRRWLKDDAEFMAGELVKYLCGCKDKYPLWAPAEGYTCGGGCGDKQSPVPLDAGIYIPKRRRGGCC